VGVCGVSEPVCRELLHALQPQAVSEGESACVVVVGRMGDEKGGRNKTLIN
jgi:hypothetical protein